MKKISNFVLACLLPFLLGSKIQEPIIEIIKDPKITVYQPKHKWRGEMVVYLHGGCGYPKKRCALWADKVTSEGNWLICPGAVHKCKKRNGRSWNVYSDQQYIEESINFVKKLYPNRIIDTDRKIIGFSLGTIMASKIIQENQKYNEAVLISAFIKLNSNKLKNKKITLMAGKQDITFNYLKRLNNKLIKNNINSRFISLGNIGHDVPKNISNICND